MNTQQNEVQIINSKELRCMCGGFLSLSGVFTPEGQKGHCRSCRVPRMISWQQLDAIRKELTGK